MSSSPPPPSGYTYIPGRPSPVVSKAQLRQQQRLAAAQVRVMKSRAKMAQRGLRLQRRALHRSILGPLLLLVAGILLLLVQTGRLNWAHALSWYSHWWPAILIAIGILLLLEWAIDQRRESSSFAGPRVVGPWLGFFLLLLACAGWSLGWFTEETRRTTFGLLDQFGLHRLLNQAYEWDDTAQTALPAGMPVILRNPRGGITVRGSSSDGQIRMTLQKKAYAWQQESAEGTRRQLDPKISQTDGSLTVEISAVSQGEVDLIVDLPSTTQLTVHAEHGDASVSDFGGAVNVFSKGDGDLSLNTISGNVTARVNGDGSTVTGHKITGSVKIQGRTGDLNFSDVDGALTLEGDFFGSTHLEHIGDKVIFQTSRTHFEVARLSGSLDLDGGPNFQADGLVGPLVLNTKNRNITLDRLTGSAQIANRNGSVNVSLTAPVSPIQITNERGSVDLALPSKASFQLSAETRNGDVENDFGLTEQENGNAHSVSGSVLGGGAAIHVNTTEGGITVRKNTSSSSAEGVQRPEPPKAPTPPGSAKHLRGSMPAFQRM